MTDASLPPADVQRPTPPLTEEELENFWHQDSLHQWAVRRLIADLRAKEEELQRVRTALDFYANPGNWEARLVHEAPADGPNAGASAWESGAAIDGGERARRALNVPLP